MRIWDGSIIVTGTEPTWVERRKDMAIGFMFALVGALAMCAAVIGFTLFAAGVTA